MLTCNMFGSLFGFRNSWLDNDAFGFFGCDRFSIASALSSLCKGKTQFDLREHGGRDDRLHSYGSEKNILEIARKGGKRTYHQGVEGEDGAREEEWRSGVEGEEEGTEGGHGCSCATRVCP